MTQSHYQCRLIDIGSYDMRFFRQIGGSTDYIVFSRTDSCYICCIASGTGSLKGHKVTHCHRIGGANTFQAEISFHFALVALAALGLDYIAGSCINYYASLHF